MSNRRPLFGWSKSLEEASHIVNLPKEMENLIEESINAMSPKELRSWSKDSDKIMADSHPNLRPFRDAKLLYKEYLERIGVNASYPFTKWLDDCAFIESRKLLLESQSEKEAGK